MYKWGNQCLMTYVIALLLRLSKSGDKDIALVAHVSVGAWILEKALFFYDQQVGVLYFVQQLRCSLAKLKYSVVSNEI